MRIGIGISGDLRDRIQRTLGRRVIAKYAVAFAHLFQGANRVRFRTGAMPHLLTLHKKCVPVIVVGIRGENPVVSLSSRSRHRSLGVGSNIHADTQKAKQNVGVRPSRGWHAEAGADGNISSKMKYPFYFLT